MSLERLVTLAIIGAGQRGNAYARLAIDHPEKCKVVAVAEPRPKTREIMVAAHNIPASHVFNDFDEFLAASAASIAKGKTDTLSGRGHLADAVLVTVLDQQHKDMVVALAAQGYNVLCEKPMATSAEDCIAMADAMKQSGKIMGIGHVLRYSPYNQEMVKVIASGELGNIVNVHHVEPVGYFHFAHSYVRGHWSVEDESSFSLMTKSCHDVDIVCRYLAPAKPVRVSSFGSLTHFKKSGKPAAAGSATRCLECPIKDECAYSAKRIYLDPVARGSKGWPASTIVDGLPDIENIGEALKNGRYGTCVYESPNDVVDNQVVIMEFDGGQTVSFTMAAFSERICERQTRIHFDNGEIVGDMTSFTSLNFSNHHILGKDEENGAQRASSAAKILHEPKADHLSGHGGGDIGLIETFVEAVRLNKQEILDVTVDDILSCYLTVFAAETSRREGRVVDVQAFEADVRKRMASANVPNGSHH